MTHPTFPDATNPWDDVSAADEETETLNPEGEGFATIAELHRDRRIAADRWIASRDDLVARYLAGEEVPS